MIVLKSAFVGINLCLSPVWLIITTRMSRDKSFRCKLRNTCQGSGSIAPNVKKYFVMRVKLYPTIWARLVKSKKNIKQLINAVFVKMLSRSISFKRINHLPMFARKKNAKS